MHLTRVLNFYKKLTRVPGLVTSGKHRILKPLKPLRLRNSVKWMLMEEDNKILLNKPYITETEESAFVAVRGGMEEQRKELLQQQIKAKKFRKSMSLEEHLEHLNVNKGWE